MNYQDLQSVIDGGDIAKTIEILTSQADQPDTKKLQSQWFVTGHDVMDRTKRRDRDVLYEEADEDDATTKVKSRIESVARIPVPFQKNIVSKAVSFLFGNPVKIVTSLIQGEELRVLNAVKTIWDDTKADSQNRVIAKELFRSTQVAEIWYPVRKDEEHDDYGFPTPFKLRMAVFSPWDGHELYPLFDDHGDMIAFSRRYVIRSENDRDEQYIETYTADQYYRWKNDVFGWRLIENSRNIIGRIPVVYASQEQAEWAEVQYSIDRLETILSNHADTNDYNGSPIVVAEGQILSIGKKGERGKVVEMEKGGKLSYLSWDHAPTSVKMEIENLFKIILSYTQTPDISFESVKGMGAISGTALKLMFMDAHLKVLDKREVFDAYLKRRLNIIKAFVGVMDKTLAPTAKKLRIDAEIVPYIIQDDMERMNMLLTANGGKAVISQKTSVGRSGLVSDPSREFELLQAEQD